MGPLKNLALQCQCRIEITGVEFTKTLDRKAKTT